MKQFIDYNTIDFCDVSKTLSQTFWEATEPSIDGYSRAIQFLLDRIPTEQLSLIVQEWAN